MKNNRILLGLSGGVDSTAAALLLKQQGFDVIGYYFDVLGDQNEGLEKAGRAAECLRIEFLHRDVSQEFEEQVIRPFCRSYETGQTPNPCILCNPAIKFRTMAEEADRMGAAWIATGHYARILRREGEGNDVRIAMAANGRKDQSYMLYRLPDHILRRLVLPLGEIEDKEQVRNLVREFGIFNADHADSQEICFIPDDDYVAYLQQRGISDGEGSFIDRETGDVLGKHKGIIHYTVGQRKGLGMTFGRPRFVTAIDGKSHAVILGSNEDLFSSHVTARDVVFFGRSGDEGRAAARHLMGRPLLGKIRYGAAPSECVISHVSDDAVTISFSAPQRAATPGQSVVLYDGEILVGGGFITVANPT